MDKKEIMMTLLKLLDRIEELERFVHDLQADTKTFINIVSDKGGS